ncbi:hypothetical protein HAX54_028596 [Datura stramonium]|uniref:Uncharacterized protein n=1 Tax=Datura stramonium TaxID=4076 RepID=A0ABS8V792_DATST|nr:hypothetical protein [Datura stramonium]
MANDDEHNSTMYKATIDVPRELKYKINHTSNSSIRFQTTALRLRNSQKFGSNLMAKITDDNLNSLEPRLFQSDTSAS